MKELRVSGGHKCINVLVFFFFFQKLKILGHFSICTKARVDSEPQTEPTAWEMRDCQSNLEDGGCEFAQQG